MAPLGGAGEWALMWRRVQLVTLAGEKYAEAALIRSVAINSASASFTHSLSHDFFLSRFPSMQPSSLLKGQSVRFRVERNRVPLNLRTIFY